MLSSMSSQQLNEWMAYLKIEPAGEWRADLRNAQLCALLANINRDAKSRPEPYEASDFMLDFDASEKPPEERSTDMRQKIVAINAMLGGIDNRNVNNRATAG